MTIRFKIFVRKQDLLQDWQSRNLMLKQESCLLFVLEVDFYSNCGMRRYR